MSSGGVGTSVWLDEESYALLMKAVEILEGLTGQRMTSGQVVKAVLKQWLQDSHRLTDEK
jgi:hypothetical protein